MSFEGKSKQDRKLIMKKRIMYIESPLKVHLRFIEGPPWVSNLKMF